MANVVHICKICTIFTILFLVNVYYFCHFLYVYNVSLNCKYKVNIQRYLKKKKKRKKERKRAAHQLTKPKILFMSLLAQFIYLIEIEVSYSLLETILAKINNAPQEEVKKGLFVCLFLFLFFVFYLICLISFVVSLLPWQRKFEAWCFLKKINHLVSRKSMYFIEPIHIWHNWVKLSLFYLFIIYYLFLSW